MSPEVIIRYGNEAMARGDWFRVAVAQRAWDGIIRGGLAKMFDEETWDELARMSRADAIARIERETPEEVESLVEIEIDTSDLDTDEVAVIHDRGIAVARGTSSADDLALADLFERLTKEDEP